MRILLVEDDRDHAELACIRLEEAGVDTEVVPNAEEALATLSSETHFDAVVTDFLLPGRSGAQLLSELHDRRPELPVVILTSADHGDLAAVTLRCGAMAYLVKDTALEYLERLAEILSEAASAAPTARRAG